jgi:hypothetical protein
MKQSLKTLLLLGAAGELICLLDDNERNINCSRFEHQCLATHLCKKWQHYHRL